MDPDNRVIMELQCNVFFFHGYKVNQTQLNFEQNFQYYERTIDPY